MNQGSDKERRAENRRHHHLPGIEFLKTVRHGTGCHDGTRNEDRGGKYAFSDMHFFELP